MYSSHILINLPILYAMHLSPPRTHQIFELIIDENSLNVQPHRAGRGGEHVSREFVGHLRGEEQHRLRDREIRGIEKGKRNEKGN